MFDPDFEYELEQIRHKSPQQQLAQQHREYRELCKADSWWDEQDKAILSDRNEPWKRPTASGTAALISEQDPSSYILNEFAAKWATFIEGSLWWEKGNH